MRAVIAILCLSGCASQYRPRLVARGELVLQYDHGFELHAGGARVSGAPTWAGLSSFVRCVPVAADLAARARRHGQVGLAFAIVGGVLGAASVGGLVGLADEQHQWAWLGSGLGAAGAGVIFAGLSRLLRNRANQEAVDAYNYYNDAVGSLGGTCQPDAPLGSGGTR